MYGNKNFFLNLISKLKNFFSKKRDKENKKDRSNQNQDDDIYPLF